MELLIIGLIVFTGMHLVPSIPALRSVLVSNMGEMPYKAGFTAISFLGLGLMIYGLTQADFVPVWEPVSWGRVTAAPLMLISFILLGASHASTNIKRFTRHPMLWGIVIWSVAHLLNNGDQASVILFGGLGLYSLVGMLSQTLRGAALSSGRVPVSQDIKTVVIGAVVYAVFLFLHPYLFGVAVV